MKTITIDLCQNCATGKLLDDPGRELYSMMRKPPKPRCYICRGKKYVVKNLTDSTNFIDSREDLLLGLKLRLRDRKSIGS